MPTYYPAGIATQIHEISQHLANYPSSAIAQSSLNSLILQCPDGAIAKTLAGELAEKGYAAIVRRGRLSSHYYIQVPFNPPAGRRAAA